MHLFMDYINPLTTWLYANPHWALFITFLISFSESLAIIGSIVPGSVTMTAIGILAGSGVMRIDLTLLAATLGAIAGDSASYTLGFVFRHSLPNIWPFSRYPTWLAYGQQYFAKHGGKSVLIGRFIGPLRSIIPVIAGMMQMNRWYFFIVNVISAIGWSIVYIMPGVLIGAASSELSAENASRLFLFIIILLIIIWLLGIGIKWLIIRMHLFLKEKLHKYWIRLRHHSRLKGFANRLTPENETNHYSTVGLLILFGLSVLISLIITLLVVQDVWISYINTPVYFFFKTVHTHYFDAFFILILLVIKPLSLAGLFASIVIYLIYHSDWRTLIYWLSLSLTTALLALGLSYFVQATPISTPLNQLTSPGYPSIDMTFATTLFGFLIFYISTRYRTTVTLTIRIILMLLLFLSGIGVIYLGENWISGVLGAYFVGFTICLGHWILYRRVQHKTSRSQLPIVYSCLVLVLMTFVSYGIYYGDMIRTHQPYYKQYKITGDTWWNQKEPLLPVYTTNRIGHKKGVFNLQFAGNLASFEQDLSASGWQKQTTSFFYSLVERASGVNTIKALPLFPQMYQSRKPALVMTYHPTAHSPMLILWIWRSNYTIDSATPIWLGSIHTDNYREKNQDSNYYLNNPDELFAPLFSGLNNHQFKKMLLNDYKTDGLAHKVAPIILLIKDREK